jgi:signal transduction histidine kinase
MSKLCILHLEDSDADASLVQRTLRASGIDAEIVLAKKASEFLGAIGRGGFDVILADNGVPGLTGLTALKKAREKCPSTPFICVSGHENEAQALASRQAGAWGFVAKDHLWQLAFAIPNAVQAAQAAAAPRNTREPKEGLTTKRLAETKAQLEAVSKELETFTYSVSHDLRAPLRAISAFVQVLFEDCAGELDVTAREHLERIRSQSARMAALLEHLVRLARISRADLHKQKINLTELAEEIKARLEAAEPARRVEWRIQPRLEAEADPALMRTVLENLLGNAWKFTSKSATARIQFGAQPSADGSLAYFVKDNGLGFDPPFAVKLFGPFQHLHSEADLRGAGIGLAAVQRIIHKHGGRVWAEGSPGKGACFYFTLP